MFLPSNITLKFGDSGDFVAELQRRLAMVRTLSEDNINGFFDGPTANAVTSFQSREGLRADGVAGPETLRRLNGVIAGDTTASSGGSDTKQEEEAAVTPLQVAQEILQPQPSTGFEAALYGAHAPYGEEAYRAATPEPIAPVIAPPPPVVEPAPLAQQEEIRRQQEQAPAHHQQQTDAAAMLQQQMAANQPRPQEFAARPERVAQPVPETPPQREAAPEPAQQPQSMMGRARQFANAMIQKLSDYFEAKLPPSVLREVQAIGVAMAQSGMKENPIPTGPELAQRAPELPERGPQQGQQRS